MQTTRVSPIRRPGQRGVTLLELIVTIFILSIISTAAVTVQRFSVTRRKEWELRGDLREIRTAIDKYKDLADKNLIRTQVGNEGYPPDLDTLVKGVDIGSAGPRIRFLRKVPIDPMTGRTDWALRSMQDDPDSRSWSGNNVFDVHSSSQSTALNGTLYSTW